MVCGFSHVYQGLTTIKLFIKLTSNYIQLDGHISHISLSHKSQRLERNAASEMSRLRTLFFAKKIIYSICIEPQFAVHYLVVQISEKSSFCCSIVFLCSSSMHPLTPENSSHSCYNGVCLGYVFVYTIFSKSKKKNARLRLSIFHEILIAFNRPACCILSLSKKLLQLVT